MREVAYIRRSFSRRNDPGDVSREFQTEEVRNLAGDGEINIIDGDWGISAAREHQHRRLAFLGMLEAIERGEVSAVYAFSSDRLARSVQWAVRLLDACEDHGVTIVTGEGRYAPGDDASRQMFMFQAMQNESALRGMKRKAQASYAVRRERGDHLGPAPYGMQIVDGKLAPRDGERYEDVTDAYKATGSYQGTARVLNQRKIPSRLGRPWTASSVRDMLLRRSPELVPVRPSRGRPPKRSFLLARLLRCSCGRSLTGRANSRGRRGVSYECKAAAMLPEHLRPYSVAESVLLPWVRGEAARLNLPDRIEIGDDDTEGKRADLMARRTRVVDAFLDGTIDKARRDAEIDAIAAELDRLAFSATEVVDVPQIDWDTWSPEDVNAVLRTMWRRIQLGADLRPVCADWRLPAEYVV